MYQNYSDEEKCINIFYYQNMKYLYNMYGIFIQFVN